MRQVTLRGLLAHKLRLALTALAIVLGVTFISGTFVLTDTLNNTFSSLFTSVYSKIDFQVRGVAQFGSGSGATRNPLPESLLARVQSVPGVGGTYGEVQGYAQFIGHDGKPISSTTGMLGVGWDTNPQISSLHLIAGNPPTTSGDVVMDAATAKSYDFSVGQPVRILGGGLKSAQTFTITGIAQFGTADNLAGATLAAFTLPTAQRVVGETGVFNFIDLIAKPGADKAAVQRSVAQALPSDAEVVTAQTLINEEQSTVSQALSFFNTALLVFALISLFVGAFTIYNTFSIIVGQRTRELALLRVVGASRGQVLRSVLAEAAIVGFASSAIGVGLGVAAAIGLKALLNGFGTSLPAGPLMFEPRTAIVGLVVGTLVTVISAIGPARNAIRVPPVAALTDRATDGAGVGPSRRRLISGTVLAVLGVLLLGIGLSKPVVALVGVGAVFVFIGVAMLAPAVARPLSGVLGRPLAALLGTPGQLGRENSMRSPRRTAQTASALMVGLALVCAMAVFGASLSKSATSSVDQAISADLLISVNGSGQLSDSLPAAVAHVPGVTATSTVYRDQFEFQSTLATLTGVTTQNLADTVILRMTSGSTAALGQGELLIDSTTATKDHLAVGDTVPVQFAHTGPTAIRIGGIYQSNALIQSYLVSAPYFLAHFRQPHPGAILARANGTPGVETAVSNALAPYGNVQV
jgi:putative ABC transport system permease protein